MMPMPDPAPGYPEVPPASHDLSFKPGSFPANQNHFPTTADVSIGKAPINNENVTAAAQIPANGQPIKQTPIPPPLSKHAEGAVLANHQIPSKNDEKMETEPTVPSRAFIDPLTFKYEQLESDYVTRELGQSGINLLFLSYF